MKKSTAIIAITLIAGVAGFLLAKVEPFSELLGSPKVTLINLTGAAITEATVSFGSTKASIRNLQHGQSRTVTICGPFAESATHVGWADAEGDHKAVADDYMEAYGCYRSVVVLTSDHKAIAIRETGKD